ncbi:conserved hypothetical protein (plasmid) [Borreliella burgdorferi JD1]|nr:conserved hypothetical protein [Borreliella burgdorferi JD1]
MHYFYSVFLLEFARTLYHAALTIILINKGLSLKDIAIVQICRKVSIFFQMISYFIIFKASSFMLLCISWFI